MSLSLLFVLLFGIVLYWAITQVLPERRKASLLRPALADGVLSALNEARVKAELPPLEWDDGLAAVAENKATHQLLTGRDEEGWDYPPSYAELLGQSLIMEALFTGPLQQVIHRAVRQRDIQAPDWLACGIGVASVESSEQVVVALIFCREAWETAAETNRRGLTEGLKAF